MSDYRVTGLETSVNTNTITNRVRSAIDASTSNNLLIEGIKSLTGQITLDARSASASTINLVNTDTGSSLTLQFSNAADVLGRTGASDIEVISLLDKTAAEVVTGSWSFSQDSSAAGGVSFLRIVDSNVAAVTEPLLAVQTALGGNVFVVDASGSLTLGSVAGAHAFHIEETSPGSEPVGVAGRGSVFTRDAAGIIQLFFRSSDGTLHQLTPAVCCPLQAGYDNDPAIVLTAANPVDLTTTAPGQDGITITDGTNTTRLRGAELISPCLLSNSDTVAVDTAGTSLVITVQEGGDAAAANAGDAGVITLLGTNGGDGLGPFAGGIGTDINLTAGGGGAPGAGNGGPGGNITLTAGIGQSAPDGDIYFIIGGVSRTLTTAGTSNPDGAAGSPSYSFTSDTISGLYLDTPGTVSLVTDGAPRLVTDGLLEAGSGEEIAFHLTPSINQTGTAGYVGLLLDVDTSGGTGSGAAEILTLQKDSVDVMTVNGAGNLVVAGTIAASAGTAADPTLTFATQTNLGFSAPNTDELVLSTGGVALSVMKQGLVHASANEVSYSITPTINKVAGNYTALLINATQTAAPGAANKLLDIQADSASVASISSTGEVSCTNLVSTSTTASTFQGDVLVQNGAALNAGTGKFIWQRVWDSKAGTSYTVEPQADRGDRFAWNNASDVIVTFNTAAGGVQNGAVVELKHEGAGGLILASGTATVRLPPGKALRSKGQYSSLVAQYRQNTEVYVSGDLARKVRQEAGIFTVNGDDYDVLVDATTTTPSTNVTVNTGIAGQVTTIVLTGTAGTLEFVAGTATIEVEEGKTVTTVAPGASTIVTISIMYLSASVAKITGNLA